MGVIFGCFGAAPFMNKIDLDWFSGFRIRGTYFGLERRFDALLRALTAIAHQECGFFEYGVHILAGNVIFATPTMHRLRRKR